MTAALVTATSIHVTGTVRVAGTGQAVSDVGSRRADRDGRPPWRGPL